MIRISSSAYGDRFTRRKTPQFRLERRGIEMFDEDLALKRFRIVELHEFVGVARITILAAEFAAAVRIDHPAERHARTIAARQIFPRRKFEIFGLALGFERGAFRR